MGAPVLQLSPQQGRTRGRGRGCHLLPAHCVPLRLLLPLPPRLWLACFHGDGAQLPPLAAQRKACRSLMGYLDTTGRRLLGGSPHRHLGAWKPCPLRPPHLAPPQGAPQSEPSAPARLQSPRQQQLTCNGPFSLKDEEGVGQRLTLRGRPGRGDGLPPPPGEGRSSPSGPRTVSPHPLTCVSQSGAPFY